MAESRTIVSSSTPRGSIRPPDPLGENLLSEWLLDPELVYLDHGCYGARPRSVSQAQRQWRERIERDPVERLDRQRHDLLDQAKESLAPFLGVRPHDFGFVTNATGGVNAVLRSLRFEPGDEIVTVDHVYNAVRMSMRFVADRTGAKTVEIPVWLPIASPDELIATVENALTDHTKLVIIDHVASPTAVVFPVKQIVARCEQRGVDVLVDGAHAPGMLPLDIASLGAAYYTGNLHKWVCAPLGSAFLWVRPDRQENVHPLTISHFYGETLAEELDWQGTRDISAWLSVPAALAYFEQFGFENVRQHNHAMARWAQSMLCERWEVDSITPLDGSTIGSMATLPLPEGLRGYGSAQALRRALRDHYRIEVPILDWNDRWWVRVSCQIYNRPADYERLATAITQLDTQ